MIETIPPLLPTRPRAAFERTLLPGFARWFIERAEDLNPDLFVPAETKGARLLERVLRYARESLGVTIDIPILYSTALAYTDKDYLRGARVLIVDDAIRTGQNIARHRERTERYGARNITAMACIAYGEDPSYDERPVECFRVVDDLQLYREYVWQLTELIATRGLPPEVDHHVLTLRLPERLPVALETLREALAGFGCLSVDEWHAGVPGVLTLHFPELPGVLEHPSEGKVRIEGASKIRLFASAAGDEIHVVPMSFPALDLPEAESSDVGADRARELVRGWAQTETGIGELLVGQAWSHDAEMVFRALSTVTELNFLCGLARVLARAFPAQEISLVSQRELFAHLYGPEVGGLVADRIDEAVRAALEEQPEPAGRDDDAWGSEARGIVEPDADVVQMTRNIAEHLKELYDKEARAQGPGLTDPVGQSLSEMAVSLDLDTLLVSRCVDFGCSMTTLVPYVRVEPQETGISVRRKYRVSEINRAPGEPYEDLNDVRQQLSEETVAFVAHYLSTHSHQWHARPIPATIVGWLVAILRPLVLEPLGLALAMQWQGEEVGAVLRDGVPARTLLHPSASFVLEDGGIVPTELFKRLSAQESLRIDRRRESVEIEDYLGPLAELIDSSSDEEGLRRMLAGWALSADGRLGLSYVDSDLESVLRSLDDLLKPSLREEPDSQPAVDPTTSVDELVDCARDKLELLKGNWGATVHACWPEPTRRQGLLLKSIAAASDPATIYELVEALADLTSCAARLVAFVAHARIVAEAGDETPASTAIAAVLADCAKVRRALSWLEGEGEAQVPEEPEEPYELIAAAATELSDVLALVRSFLAAVAGSYRGPRGARLLYERPLQRSGTVLYADLSGSRGHASKHGVTISSEWKNSGLNLIAQWAKAFGGREMKDREGDAIWLEFEEHGDPAVLCGAAVQQYAHALRSMDQPLQWWGLYVAVDHGDLLDRDGGNVMGPPCDRIVSLAKDRGQVEQALEDVTVSGDATARCSVSLHKRLSQLGPALAAGDAQPNGHAVEGELADASALDAEAAMRDLCERIRATAAAVAARPALPPAPSLIEDNASSSIEPESGQLGASGS